MTDINAIVKKLSDRDKRLLRDVARKPVSHPHVVVAEKLERLGLVSVEGGNWFHRSKIVRVTITDLGRQVVAEIGETEEEATTIFYYGTHGNWRSRCHDLPLQSAKVAAVLSQRDNDASVRYGDGREERLYCAYATPVDALIEGRKAVARDRQRILNLLDSTERAVVAIAADAEKYGCDSVKADDGRDKFIEQLEKLVAKMKGEST